MGLGARRTHRRRTATDCGRWWASPSEQNVTIAPGSSTTLQVGAQNATANTQSVGIEPVGSGRQRAVGLASSDTLSVPANGRATLPVTISASSSAPLGYNWVTATLTMSGGATQTVKVACWWRNREVCWPQPTTPASPTTATSIRPTSTAAGPVTPLRRWPRRAGRPGATKTVNGVDFTWPQSTPGWPDNVIAQGQNISVNAPSGTQTLAFLGSATDGPSEGVVTEHYTDGSSAQYWLGLSDWTLNGGSSQPSYGNQTAITLSYRNCSYCSPPQQNVATYVFYAAVPVDPSKTLASVTLPDGASTGALHVFSIGTSTAAAQRTGRELGDAEHRFRWAAGDDQRLGLWRQPGFRVRRVQRQRLELGRLRTDRAADRQLERQRSTFTVPSSVSPGSPASVTVVTGSGSMSDSPELEITPTANPSDYYDGTGTSPDNNQACANYDGVGYSYSANALASAGFTPGATVSADGLTFKWTSGQPCSPDNILAAGQTMLVSGPAGSNTLGLLESSTDGGYAGHDHDQLHRRDLVHGHGHLE